MWQDSRGERRKHAQVLEAGRQEGDGKHRSLDGRLASVISGGASYAGIPGNGRPGVISGLTKDYYGSFLGFSRLRFRKGHAHDETMMAPADSAFDRGNWGIDAPQVAAISLVAAFAVALWGRNAPFDRDLACLLIVQVVGLCLPWRLPRGGRSGASIWAETLLADVASLGAIVVAAAGNVSWVGATGTWQWYAVAPVVGLGLLLLGRTRLTSVFSGELAFVLGPTRQSHRVARAFSIATSSAGEEALYRGPVLLTPHPASLSLLGAAAFVAMHHVLRGSSGRGTVIVVTVEVVSAISLLALVQFSGSIYPAVLAHAVNNMPGFITELQRENVGKS